MDTRSFQPGPLTPESASDYLSQEHERFSVVPEWVDGDGAAEVDLASEVVGLKVVLVAGSGLAAVAYDSKIAPTPASESDTPGFLFVGDDGDSLWFWPEPETVAFRFEQTAGDELRKRLSEAVHRLISEGALVFCFQRRSSAQNVPAFWFPKVQQLAA